ncbi:MAG TPA: peptidoglycan DD-metalloendopeptidase family protein [Actinomycetota bacterium]|nr:peptidoglycan DD-metalloendopeptidase family protein [Actinomycetota bacterium]
MGTLLIPSVTSLAGPEDELDATERKLEQLRDELESDKAAAANVKDRIDLLNSQIAELRHEIARLDVQIARVESEVRSAEARIDRTQGRIDAVEGRAKQQAISLYKAGTADVLDTLLDANSIAELDARVEMLDVAARENVGALVEFGRLRAQLERESRELFARQQELDQVRSQQAAAMAALEDREQRLAADLAELEGDIVSAREREGVLERRAGELRRRILAAQAPPSVTPTSNSPPPAPSGQSSSGFMWPLNGPVTSPYGPRWGRMHTGIDIDGYSGQPIVASKSGRVILASAYSGYGNAVIVDHGGGISTLYGHMTSFGVSRGQSVSQGQVVGTVGCTGSCTGDHLHFEVRVNGSPVDPMGYLP